MSQDHDFKNLLDPELLRSLETLGLIPPQNLNDFIKLTAKLKETPLVKPERLKDPFEFIKKEPKQRKFCIPDTNAYQQNLANAARNGKPIPDFIKDKMKEDKKNSKNSNGK